MIYPEVSSYFYSGSECPEVKELCKKMFLKNLDKYQLFTLTEPTLYIYQNTYKITLLLTNLGIIS